jgi:hypothetical protein
VAAGEEEAPREGGLRWGLPAAARVSDGREEEEERVRPGRGGAFFSFSFLLFFSFAFYI